MQEPRAHLREALKVALQDAKAMFDDGLLNDEEYKDLKSHELSKYKSALSNIDDAGPREAQAPPSSHAEGTHAQAKHDVALLRECEDPAKASSAFASTPREPVEAPDDGEPAGRDNPRSQSAAGEREGHAVDDSEAGLYDRLHMPPIFRRKSMSSRRTIVIDGRELESICRDDQRE